MYLAIAEVNASYTDIRVVGKGISLKTAYDDLKRQIGELTENDNEINLDDDDIEFVKGDLIKVEFSITEKVVVTSTPKVLAVKPISKSK